MTEMGQTYTLECLNYINGQFVNSSHSFANTSPVDNRHLGSVHEADQNLVDQAVTAARRALKGPWGRMSVPERSRLLQKVADRIDQRFDEFVAAEIADTGKPYSQASTLDVPRAGANFRNFARLAESLPNESYITPTPDGQDALNYSLRKPLGVVAVISPWNLPLLLMSWKLAPALVCGNTIVAKPSEVTPNTATLLAQVFHETGFPPGVFNLIHGFGEKSAGEYLCAHPEVDAITFTGESRTGSHIMKAASEGLRDISFELGGKNAALVFDDVDLGKAMDGVARSTFTNCGQVCLCTERVYVHESVFAPFVEGMKQRAEALILGDPYADSTTTGPLISHEHREKVMHHYRLAVQEGAELVTGGNIPDFTTDERLNQGAWISPTIFTGLNDSSATQQQEIFGPVCHITPFSDEDEAIAMANNTDYGLAAAVWTDNLSRGHRVAAQMDVGISWVNTWFLRDLRTPFGGGKMSGIGREGGVHSLDFYSHISNLCIKL